MNRRALVLIGGATLAALIASCGSSTKPTRPLATGSSSTIPASTTVPTSTTTVVTTSSTGPVPVLGRAAAYPHGNGFGQMEPQFVFLGGEAESAVTQITWSSWGSATATGTGTGCYYSGSQGSVNCRHEQATLLAFDLGTCDGTFLYQRLEYVFTEEGQSFDPSQALNICTGP